MSAGQVDLTPLFMCSPLYGLSVCPVKGRGPPEGGGFGLRLKSAMAAEAATGPAEAG
jgi:hypothetical protein